MMHHDRPHALPGVGNGPHADEDPSPWPAARADGIDGDLADFAIRHDLPGTGSVCSDNPVVRSRKSKLAKASDSVTWHHIPKYLQERGSLRIEVGGPDAMSSTARNQGIVTLMGGPDVARRAGAQHNKGNVDCTAARSGRARRSGAGGRIGVVKLLRARGGCLGVIRMSGVEGCEKSGGAAQRASIPECPRNPGTETSQYPEEKKATATPSVAASERGPA